MSYYDPYIKKLPVTRKFNIKLNSIELTKQNLTNSDAVLIHTDHDNIKYNLIKKYSKKIFDSRGIFKVQKNIIRV